MREGVRKPRAFTLAELKKMPTETVTTVLQCSGNGRGSPPVAACGVFGRRGFVDRGA